MLRKFAGLCAAVLISSSVAAYDGLVEKKSFSLPVFQTVSGQTIKNVKIGYETYGKLNAAGDNAIFVAHFFSGTSHAAGKYKAEDKAPGYWDSIIGAGKAIDTDRYFVVSADTLVNLNTKDPNVFTTGPATINPDTGKAYGMSFPVVTIRDFVNTQKALLDSLGVKKLAAVAGASMGSMQAMEWATDYPDFVERVIAVIPAGLESSAYVIGGLNLWAVPIRLDPKWNNGDYYGKEEPVRGVAEALKAVTLTARHYGWAESTFGRKAAGEKNPAEAMDAKYAIEDTLDKVGAARAANADANSFLYLVKASQVYTLGQGKSLDEAVKRVKAKVLLVPAKSDLLLFPEYSKKAMSALKANGNTVEYFEIEGDGGHLDGLFQITKAAEVIRNFLAK